jgi:leader peptidase (prepilin peptidase)/N-methyltransferase
MALLELLQSSNAFLLLTVGLVGLMAGSFLNVVIYRLPIMMERGWRRECLEFLEQDSGTEKVEKFTLSHPHSSCPKCNAAITALQNIPVLSYLFLRGKCANCKAGISARYPVIEMVTALLSLAVAAHFGYGLETISALILTWCLICLTMIDYDTQLLPDSITLPLLWCGLFLSLENIFVDSHSSIIGAIAGYLSLWSIYHLFRIVTGKEGMGFGDFKLLAVLGAWLGWQMLPIIIIISSLVGAIVGTLLLITQKQQRGTPIPFGPFLAAAGWITLLWGNQISEQYFILSGLN